MDEFFGYIIILLIGATFWVFGELGIEFGILTVLIDIFIIISLSKLWNKYYDKKEKERSKFLSHLGETRISISIKKDTKFINNHPFESFFVEMSGMLCSANKSLSLELHVYEQADDGEKLPVKAALDIIQPSNCKTVCIKKNIEIPYEDSEIITPIQVIPPIPIDILTFSRKGRIKLIFDLSATYKRKLITTYTNGIPGPSYTDKATAKAEYIYVNNELGYEDRADEMRKACFKAVRLAAIIARCDGHLDIKEANIIHSYIQDVIDKEEDSSKSSFKDQLNACVSESFAINEVEIMDYIDEHTLECFEMQIPNKLMILDLILKVIRADGVVRNIEFNILERIVKNIDIDYDEYKKIRDKLISVDLYEKTDNNSGNNIRQLIGINNNMSVAEIKSLLNKEYRKWNQLQNSNDEKIQKQAKQMIKLIAKERSKLDK